MNWTELLFSFSGRINRARYWLFFVIYLVSVLILAGIAALLVPNPAPAAAIAYAIVALVWFIVLFIGSIAVVSGCTIATRAAGGCCCSMCCRRSSAARAKPPP